MKKVFYFILSMFLLSCSGKEDLSINEELEGEWTFHETKIYVLRGGALYESYVNDYSFTDDFRIRFFNTGVYHSVNNEPFYFSRNIEGAWKFIYDKSHLHFDKGIFELFGERAAILKIEKLNNSQLILRGRTNFNSMFSFGYYYGYYDGWDAAYFANAASGYEEAKAYGKIYGFYEGYTEDYRSGLDDYPYTYKTYFGYGFYRSFLDNYTPANPLASDGFAAGRQEGILEGLEEAALDMDVVEDCIIQYEFHR
ncbi:MAG: hypothetical protein ACK4ND_16655 [Cytophagaceae bacterium]